MTFASRTSDKYSFSSKWKIAHLSLSVGARVSIAVNILVFVYASVFLTMDYKQEYRARLLDKAISLGEQATTLQQAVAEIHRKPVVEQQRFIDAVCRRICDEESPQHHIVVEIDGKALESQAHRWDSKPTLNAIVAASKRSITKMDGAKLLVGSHREAGVAAYVAENMESIRWEIGRQAALKSVGIMLLAFSLAIAVNVAIHKLVRKPLRRLVKTIDRVATGDFGKTNGRFEAAELAQVAAAVDAMTDSLARAERHRNASLNRARRVQQHLLPTNEGGNGLDVAFFHNAAEDVAGDYVDVFETNRGTSVICVADVVGHGIAPAMIAAMLKVVLLDAAEVCDSPGDMLLRLNDRITSVSLPEDFVTMFLGVWNPQDRRLSYVNAGHEPALFLSRGADARYLSSTGPIIGIDAAMSWETRIIDIPPGAILAGWTDGVTEAWGASDELFGRERLVSLVEKYATLGPRSLVSEVDIAMKDHAHSIPLADDCTFVAIQFG